MTLMAVIAVMAVVSIVFLSAFIFWHFQELQTYLSIKHISYITIPCTSETNISLSMLQSIQV